MADIDECSGENECGANSACVNTVPGYTCDCITGYLPQADGRTCESMSLIN